jgi:hypothetical protein
MRTSARLIAAAIALTSAMAVMSIGRVAIPDRSSGGKQFDTAAHGVLTLRAAIRTEWLSPADARRSLEARSTALSEWLRTRGGSVRVISSNSLLRTHDSDGQKLAMPRASFERILEIQVPREVGSAPAEHALLGRDGSVAIASGTGSRHGQPPRPAAVDFEF